MCREGEGGGGFQSTPAVIEWMCVIPVGGRFFFLGISFAVFITYSYSRRDFSHEQPHRSHRLVNFFFPPNRRVLR